MTLELTLESHIHTLQAAPPQLGVSLALPAACLAPCRPLWDVRHDDRVVRRGDVGLIVQLHSASHVHEPVPDSESHQHGHGESVEPPTHGGHTLNWDRLSEQGDVPVMQGVLNYLRRSAHREIRPRAQVANRGLGKGKHNPRRQHRPRNIGRKQGKREQGHHRKCHTQIFDELEIQLDSHPELAHIRGGSPENRAPPQGVRVGAGASGCVPIGCSHDLLIELPALGL
mmetsp:Transcript_80552/g.184478  ORF Transcript_80552/g.184478 Transcript_80552/m.184478 type:complete len:227 (-) Transcript_80552:296-976(-)